MATPKMWKAPPRRAYAPKPLDPGQRVQWTRETAPGERETCAGVVWSAGPVPSSLWVQPDGRPGDVVAVKVRGGELSQLPQYPAGWARDAIRRAENLRRHGSLYATVEQVTETWSWSYTRRETYRTLSWHCDAGCPEAAGKERDDRQPACSVREAVAILIGETHPAVSPRFCTHCVYLEADGMADAA